MTDVLLAQQPEPTPQERLHKLVFRGGGTKGLEHIGTIIELEKAGAWQDVREVWGSSAGGIVAVLAGIGMSAQEIQDEMSRFNFKDLMDKDTPFWSEALGIKEIDFLGVTNVTDKLAMAYRVLTSEGHGVYKGDAFADYAKLFISARTGDPNITFAELHKAATDPTDPHYDPRFKDIMLTGSKIGPPPPELRIFNWKNTPNMPIWKAVRITMSFPGAFKAVEHEGEIFVDGGLKDNLPMNPAMKFKTEDDGYHMRSTPKGSILGVSMETTKIIDYVMHGKKDVQHLADVSAADFGKDLAKASLANIEVLLEFKDSIIMPDTLKQPTLNFEMDDATKQKLLTEGRRAAQEKLGKRTDWSRYQDYHDEQDKLHIIEKWQKRQDVLLAIKTHGHTKKRDETIKKIEAKYKNFDITFTGDEAAFRKKLDAIFKERKDAREQATIVAIDRMAANEKVLALAQTHVNLRFVGQKIIRKYEAQKRSYVVLLEYSKIVIGLSKIIESIIKDTTNPNIKMAFVNLEEKIKELSIHKDDNKETFQKTLVLATTDLTGKLSALDLTPEQIANFTHTLQTYGQYIHAHPDAILPSLPKGQELTKYQSALKESVANIEEEAKNVEKELQLLEINLYKKGMTILYPEKKQEIDATLDKDCTIEKLKSAHQELKKQYTKDPRSAVISHKYFIDIIAAKQIATNTINKNTGFIVKFADLLKNHCTQLYKAFTYLACLNPFSTYKSVALMKQVEEQLKKVEITLKRNFYENDETSQDYIYQIAEMSKKLQDTHVTTSDRSKNFQELNRLLTNFEEHRKKVEPSKTPSTIVPPTPQKPSQNS